ncbi:MAG: hypothetical protein HFI92_10455 [Lachnospiraceae bacterium]|nr:hypothetical protein [Lachnospiraceae bacterium]
MKKNEFVDRLFDILNDTDDLPIRDLFYDGRRDKVYACLKDGTKFSVSVEMLEAQCIF